MLSYVATHLSDFPLVPPIFRSQPQIEHLLLLGEDELRPVGFNTLLLRALLSLFPASRPVDWVTTTASLFTQNHICDRVMVGALRSLTSRSFCVTGRNSAAARSSPRSPP